MSRSDPQQQPTLQSLGAWQSVSVSKWCNGVYQVVTFIRIIHHFLADRPDPMETMGQTVLCSWCPEAIASKRGDGADGHRPPVDGSGSSLRRIFHGRSDALVPGRDLGGSKRRPDQALLDGPRLPDHLNLGVLAHIFPRPAVQASLVACGHWREVASGGSGEVFPRQTLHCRHWTYRQPNVAQLWSAPRPWWRIGTHARGRLWAVGMASRRR